MQNADTRWTHWNVNMRKKTGDLSAFLRLMSNILYQLPQRFFSVQNTHRKLPGLCGWDRICTQYTYVPTKRVRVHLQHRQCELDFAIVLNFYPPPPFTCFFLHFFLFFFSHFFCIAVAVVCRSYPTTTVPFGIPNYCSVAYYQANFMYVKIKLKFKIWDWQPSFKVLPWVWQLKTCENRATFDSESLRECCACVNLHTLPDVQQVLASLSFSKIVVSI